MWPFSKSKQEKATLKFFNKAKGFGYAKPEKGPDIYLHSSTFTGKNLQDVELQNGRAISFKAPPEITEGKKSRAASEWNVG